MIHQPLFFPWLPYIARVALCDTVVFLDDVPFRKGYYQNRTRMRDGKNRFRLVTVPVTFHNGKKIKDVQFAPEFSRQMIKIWKGIENNYSSANFFQPYRDLTQDFFNECLVSANSNILNLNLSSIRFTIGLLGRKLPRTLLSSELNIKSKNRTNRLIEICDTVGIKNVLNGWGGSSRNSVHTHTNLIENNIRMFKFSNKKANNHLFGSISNEGVSTIHWIFIKGTDFVNQTIDNFNNTIESVI